MGLTRRKGVYFIQFPVHDTGVILEFAPGSKRLKRWKAGHDRNEAKKQESYWKTQLLMGKVPSTHQQRAVSLMLKDWADTYLALDAVKALRTYEYRKAAVERLTRFFGPKRLSDLTIDDVEAFRVAGRQARQSPLSTTIMPP